MEQKKRKSGDLLVMRFDQVGARYTYLLISDISAAIPFITLSDSSRWLALDCQTNQLFTTTFAETDQLISHAEDQD